MSSSHIERARVRVVLMGIEWAAGYTDRFGVTFVDFESKEKKRYPKKSAMAIKDLFGHMIRKG